MDSGLSAPPSPGMTILSRSGREAHLLEHRGTELAVRVAQGFEQLGMAVIVADEEVDRLAGCLQGRGEVACLPLEFRRLIRAVADDERRAQSVKMADRAQFLD